MNTTEENLKQALGLSDYEVKLYIAGLNFDTANLSDLAKAANIPRTAAYPPLQSLVKQGLISQIGKGKRIHYQSVDPKRLEHILDEQKAKLAAAIDGLSNVINVAKNDFSAQYFTGIHGINTAGSIYLNGSKRNGLWKTFENPMFPLERMGEEVMDTYIDQRVEKNIFARVIATVNQNSEWIQNRLTRLEKDMLDIIIVSPEEYPIHASLVTDGESIYMFTMQGIPFALIIHNPMLAKTFESIHDMVWDRYKK